jgi:ribonuclease-3
MIPVYKEKKFSKLEEKIGIRFNNSDYLVQALVHRSFLNENRDFPLGHNERLEFLGDAVLELVVTEYLFTNYLNPEGELTNWRAALVNATMCAQISTELGVEEYLFLSKGESKDEGTKAREYILAKVLEALIGAIYIDQGWDMTMQFITRWVLTKLPEVLEQESWIDPKSRFQESAQEIVGLTPNYKVLSENGPDHAKKFVVGVYLDKEKIAEGEGTSKQEAQVAAADNALKVKGWKRSKTQIIPRDPKEEYLG